MLIFHCRSVDRVGAAFCVGMKTFHQFWRFTNTSYILFLMFSDLLRVKGRSAGGGDDGDTDSLSGSSSKSTSPTSSPLPQHKKHNKDSSFMDYTDGRS